MTNGNDITVPIAPISAPTTTEPRLVEDLVVWATPSPFASAGKEFVMPVGLTIEQMIVRLFCRKDIPVRTHVWINGEYIPHNMYARVKPKIGASVSIKFVPRGGGGGGGKNPLRTVLQIAVIAASFALGPALGSYMFSSMIAAGTMSAATATAIGGFIISAAGGLLVNAIAPPGTPKIKSPSFNGSNNKKESPTLFIEGARNTADPFGVIPIVLGTHKMVPKLAARNFTESVNDKQYVRQLFTWGYGHITLAEEKIGETLLTNFEEVETEHILDGTSGSSTLSLYPNDVNQESLSIALTSAASWQTRTTQVNTDEIIVDVSFPRGLVTFNSSGSRTSRTVVVEARYAPTGTSSWSGTVTRTYTEATAEAVRRSIRWTGLTPGQYDVQIRRTTADSDSDQIFDETWWTALKSIQNQNPVVQEGLSLTAMRIRATDQLNGPVDQYGGIPSQHIPNWNETDWDTIEATSNPAALFRFVAMNSSEFSGVGANARPLTEPRIDLDTIQDWHEYCTAQGFAYNGVIDYTATVREVLSEIAAAGRASLTIKDGKWSVVIDRAQTTIAQHFTPVNTWGFSYTRIFYDIPHAFRVLFINEQVGYIQDERLVFDDGYDENNATDIEGLELPGITDPDLIWKHGREHLASLKLRPRTMSFYMDTEFLNAPRGARCKLAHDVINVGLTQGRIKSYTLDQDPPDNAILDEEDAAILDEEGGFWLGEESSSANITHITLDEEVTMEEGESYGIVIRNHYNVEFVKQVVTVAGSTHTLEFTTPFDWDASNIEEGNIVMFGILGRETIDVIVKDVVPEDDFTAKIIVQDYHEGIYQASQGEIPKFTSGATFPPELQKPNAPILASIQSDEEVQERNLDGSITSRMVIRMTNSNTGVVVPVVTYRVTGTDSFKSAKISQASDEQIIIEGLDQGQRYDIHIRYKRINTGGLFNNLLSDALQINNTPFIGTSAVPPDVENFRLQIIGEFGFLEWDRVSIIDFSHYKIKFSAELVGATWNSAQLLKGNVTTERYPIVLQEGTYLIKAVDQEGNESASAATIVNSVAATNFNAIITIEEDAPFSGVHDNTEVNSSSLELSDISLLTGTYKLAQEVDLGAIYTSRVTGTVTASGNNTSNVMSSWTSLSSITSLSGTDPGAWSVLLQYRITEDAPWYSDDNIIADAEDFSTAWITSNTTITANDTQAPNGTITADALIEDNTSAAAHSIFEDQTLTVAQTNTVSVWVKANGRNFIRLILADADSTGNNCEAVFNLSTGSVVATDNTGNASGAVASIIDAGNDWYRCILSGQANSSGTDVRMQIDLGEDATTFSYDGDNASGVYLWGAEILAGDAPHTATWSDWEDFITGDLKFRGIQFQAVLNTSIPTTTSSVTAIDITIDMPDRVIRFGNQAIPTEGKTYVLDPPFRELQDVQVTIIDGNTGDYPRITSKSVSGATITIYDATDNAVARTADVQFGGYGRVLT